jgi:membrane-bound lytic murein transglycosylase D
MHGTLVAQPRLAKEVAMLILRKRLIGFVLGLLAFLPPSLLAQQDFANPAPFITPVGLEPAVDFWKKIFTEYSASQLVFFDPLDMSRVYEVLEVGEDSRSSAYIDGERARIAAANGVDIERVRSQRGIKERTAAGIKRSGRYLAQIQQIFRDAGLPPELTFLPIVESSYDISARSSVGAVGIWQFMPRTGREYLRLGGGIDERRDPLESSRAAAAYLKQAYERLGSWPLAITSYNFGQAGMARAVADVGSDHLPDLIEKYNHPYWGFAPKHFYAEFLAAVEIGTNLNRYFPGLEMDAPVEIKEVVVSSKTSLASLISSSGLKKDEFYGWNPALSPTVRFVPSGYRVKLPSEKSVPPLIVAAKTPAPEPRPKLQVVHHRVKRGDTLFEIARRYGASVERIVQVNSLGKARQLKVGTTLQIPKI